MSDTGIVNPPEVAPWWFDMTWEQPDFAPLPRLLLPCGCHIRNTDYEPILCAEHLAELNTDG